MSLPQLRTQIDRLDRQLLRALNQRAMLAVRVGRVKKRQGRRCFDPKRESVVLRHVIQANRGPLAAQAVRAIYREILRQVRRLEQSV